MFTVAICSHVDTALDTANRSNKVIERLGKIQNRAQVSPWFNSYLVKCD